MSVSVGVRLHAPVHVAGGRVSASVSLRCTGGAARVPLSFVVAQVSGRWTADPAWVGPDVHAARARADMLDMHVHPREAAWDAILDDANRVGGGGRAGYAGLIFRSAPLVVCVDEPVPTSGETSFRVECVLPDMLPPTLRGTALRYSYVFVVAAAMAGSAAPQFVRVPFRVVTPEQSRHDLVIPVPTPRKAGPSPSRFLEEAPAYALSMNATLEKPPPSDDIDTALALSPNGRLTLYGRDEDLWRGSAPSEDDTPLNFMRYVPPSPKSPVAHGGASPALHAVPDMPLNPTRPRAGTSLPMYQISRGALSLARMYLPKRVHHLGDTLTAVFDFLEDDTRCYRLNARLECQEIVQPTHALGTRRPPATSQQQARIFRKVYGEHGEFVMHNRNTHVTFSIPHDAPVSFRTSAVHVRWLVHFVFLIPRLSEPSNSPRSGSDSYVGKSPVNGSRAPPDGNGHDVESEDTPSDEESSSLLANASVRSRDQDASSEPHDDIEGNSSLRDDSNSDIGFSPDAITDALQWTLPLTVTSRPGSSWGTCSQSTLQMRL